MRRPYQYVLARPHYIYSGSRGLRYGETYYGTKMAELLRAFGLAHATTGRPFYVSDESGQKTYVADVNPDGTLENLKLFAECGGESVALGPDGNVYIAAGQIYVYSPAGTLLDTIDSPERPIDLIFGGADSELSLFWREVPFMRSKSVRAVIATETALPVETGFANFRRIEVTIEPTSDRIPYTHPPLIVGYALGMQRMPEADALV